MKKLTICFSLLLLITFSCKQETKTTKEYTITVKVNAVDTDRKMAYLKTVGFDNAEGLTVDSAKVENGLYVFKGIAPDSLVMRNFVLGGDHTVFVLEPGNIEIDYNVNDSILGFFAKGTATNDSINNYRRNMFKLSDEAYAVNYEFKNLIDTKKDSLSYKDLEPRIKQQYDYLGKMQNVTYNVLKPLMRTDVGEFLFLDNWMYLTTDQLKELVDESRDTFRNSENIKKRYKKAEGEENTTKGKTYTDVKGLDINGKEVALSDYVGKGKIVLIDFWASWCGPCIASFPEVVALNNKYKNKDFMLIAISIDEDRNEWIAASKKHNVTWPQMISLPGEDISSVYGISFVPQTLLIDKDGTIIDRGTPINILDYKLAELLK